MADWNAQQYLRFAKERTQPSTDLINRLDIGDPASILDVGCGPGNSTAQLAARYPDTYITGVDSSPDMIVHAGKEYPGLEFILGDITQSNFTPESYDVVFSNAAIQWMPDHHILIKYLFGLVKPGGALACQVPMNQDEPSHAGIRTLVLSDKWRGSFDTFRMFYTLTPSGYYDLFSSCTDDFSMWLTTYYHPMKDHWEIVEWLKGTGLRPYLEKLSVADRKGFEEDLVGLYRSDYPLQQDGRVVLRFPRFFFILRK